MRRPAPLPPELGTPGFTVREARTAGVGRHRLEASDLVIVRRGIRSRADHPLEHLDLAKLVAKRHPGSFLSHETAARLWRLHVDRAWDEAIDLSVRAGASLARGRGIRSHRLDLAAGELVRAGDTLCTSPARTWLDLAAAGCSVDDLIVAADRLIWHRRPLATRLELERMLRSHPGARGLRRLRAALPECNQFSGSGRETRLRLAILHGGLPRPEPAFPVLDPDDRVIGHADLAFPEYQVLLEYEGDHHRTDEWQWRHDLERFNRYQSAGWIALRIGRAQFSDLQRTIALVEGSLRGRGWNR